MFRCNALVLLECVCVCCVVVVYMCVIHRNLACLCSAVCMLSRTHTRTPFTLGTCLHTTTHTQNINTHAHTKPTITKPPVVAPVVEMIAAQTARQSFPLENHSKFSFYKFSKFPNPSGLFLRSHSQFWLPDVSGKDSAGPYIAFNPLVPDAHYS